MFVEVRLHQVLVGPELLDHVGSQSSDRVLVAELRRHDLRLPIDDADIAKVKGGFDERRGGGGRGHEAGDILAPRNTPIHAAEDGTIAKLFPSKAAA